MLASAFLFLLATVATAQSLLPEPYLIDHQIVSGTDVSTLTATENVLNANNILKVVVTCDHVPSGYPCFEGVSDGTNSFTSVRTWYNTTNDWAEQIFYLIEPSSGSIAVTGTTAYVCNCNWKMLVEQINGIGADD
jgi:hypothetical protein